MKIKGTQTAWVAERNMQRFIAAKQEGDFDEVLDAISFIIPSLDMSDAGYTKVGTAEIEVEIVGEETLLQNAVESLKAEREKVLAEAQLKATQLDEKIQNLLAITWNGEQ